MHRLLAPALLLAACVPEPPPIAPLAPEFGEPEPRTWTDVGPVFEARCVSCHAEGGIGPFRLDTHDEAQEWASLVASSTRARSMPPYLVRGDGTCGEFEHNQWLSDDELATLTWWAEQGAPQGAGYEVLVPEPPTLSGETLDHHTPEFVPEIVGGEYAEFDEYRCFPVELPEGGPRFLTGYEVLPGNAAVVHHVIGMPVMPDEEPWGRRLDVEVATNGELMAALDADDDRLGWPCFSGAGDGVAHEGEVVSWAPGQGAVLLPDGVGLELPEGTVMVYQVHYNLVDPGTLGQPDETTIRLQLEETVERPAELMLPDRFLGGDASRNELPPGEDDVVVYYPLAFGERMDVVGVLPHMHERGRAMQVYVARPGEQQCLVEVPAWDFEWQRMYFFDEAVALESSDQLRVWCHYDTSRDDEPITPGWGTQNEMCLPGLLVTYPDDVQE